jgi:hypothetical protein
VTRWTRTAGIVAGAVMSAGALATAAFAGNELGATPADKAVSSVADKTCDSLAPAFGRAGAVQAPAVPACAKGRGAKVPEYSWQGPGKVAPQAGPANALPGPQAPELPPTVDPEQLGQHQLPALPGLPADQRRAKGLPTGPQMPSARDLQAQRGLPTIPDLPRAGNLPAPSDVSDGRNLPVQPVSPAKPG